VREVDFTSGEVLLSDGSREALDLSTLAASPIDEALLCRVKRDLEPEGLLARFTHAAQAELLGAVESEGDAFAVQLGGERRAFPEI